jgi:4-amino-4-deoxy-L-arabinose transferase-like glycosyltransferase
LLWLFALALVLRVACAIDYAHHHPYADRPVIDEESYDRWAREIAAGDWLGDEVFFQEPLYPYWLGSIYAVFDFGDTPEESVRRERTAARHIQAFYGAVAVVLLTLATARIFGARAGVIAGLAMATYRPLVFFPALFLKPNLFIPLLCLIAWLVTRQRGRLAGLFGYALLGMLAGLGALLRGNMLLLLPVFVALGAWRAWRERGEARWLGPALRRAGATFAGILLVLLPVALRNQHVGGVFALTTSGAGTNLYGGNNPWNPYGRATEFPWVRGVPEHEADDWKHEAERRSGRTLDPAEVSDFWVGETLASVRANPGVHLSILWNKLRLTLGAYEMPDNHHLGWDARFVSMLRLPLPGFGLWGVLGIAGVAAFVARRWVRGPELAYRRAAVELAAFGALYLATIVLTVTSTRVRLALLPVLLPFAGHFVDLVLVRPRQVGWVVCLAAAALVVHTPVLSPAEREEDLLKRDFNLAVVELQSGELGAASEVLARLSAARPGTVPVALLAGELELKRGLASAAGAGGDIHLRNALASVEPLLGSQSVNARDRFRAQKLAGLASFHAGSYAVAEERFREALVFDPEDPDARFLLANLLWMRAGDARGVERERALREARDLLVGLAAKNPAADYAARLQQVEAALLTPKTE